MSHKYILSLNHLFIFQWTTIFLTEILLWHTFFVVRSLALLFWLLGVFCCAIYLYLKKKNLILWTRGTNYFPCLLFHWTHPKTKTQKPKPTTVFVVLTCKQLSTVQSHSLFVSLNPSTSTSPDITPNTFHHWTFSFTYYYIYYRYCSCSFVYYFSFEKWTKLETWGVEAVCSQTPTSDDTNTSTNTTSSLVNYTTPTFSALRDKTYFTFVVTPVFFFFFFFLFFFFN